MSEIELDYIDFDEDLAEIEEKSEFEEWRDNDNRQRYRDIKSDNKRPY